MDADRLKLGIIITNPPNHSLGTIKRVKGLAEGLYKRGAELTLISPYPRRPAWWDLGAFLPLGRGPKGKLLGLMKLAAADAYYRSSFSRKLIFQNLTSIESNVRALARDLIESLNEGDIGILQAEQQVAAAAACFAKRKLRKPVIADIHNLWSFEMQE